MIDPQTAIKLGDELDTVRRQYADLASAHSKTLDVLEALTKAGKLQTECKHGAEPDFCDGCAYDREQAVTDARKLARARLRECGRSVQP
jgi:hypothetical protein